MPWFFCLGAILLIDTDIILREGEITILVHRDLAVGIFL